MKKKTLLVLLIVAVVGMLLVTVNAIIDLKETFAVAELFGVFSKTDKTGGSYFIDGEQVSAAKFLAEQWFFIIADIMEILISIFVEIILVFEIISIRYRNEKA